MLLLAAVGTIPLWLGLQRVRSAPSALPPPASPPSPVVTIDLPDQILIGEDFTFDVEFKNTPGSDVGFGTYVALYLPARGADGNLGGHKCDGIRFKSAEALFTTPATLPLVPAYNSSLDTATNNLNCPLAYTLPFPGMTLAPTPAGDYQLVVLELPLGSFQSTQPGIKVRVKANLSDYADQVTSTAGTPLTVYAVGGFRYGADALNNHPSDPLIETALVSDQTKPTVLKLKKAANAPEDETATGPNFLRKYTVTADIADGQKIDNLKIHDFLDNNVQYQGQVIVKIGATTAIAGASCGSGIDYVITKQPPTSAPQNPPNNELEILFCHSITGTAAATDVTITFAFFIPERDANTATVLPTNCKPATSTNDVKAEGDWTPADPRDQPMFQITSDLTLQDHVLADKCIAIQKSVAMAIDTGAPGLTPGDTLQYTLKFQGSDYKTFGSLVVSDMLSNGQILASPVTLTVSDQFGTKSGVMPPMFVTQAADPLGASKFCPATLQTPPNGTVLTFKISLAMAAIPGFLAPRLNAGILTGGYAAGIPPPHNPAVGTITFRAKVLDDFQYAVSPGDKFVDKEDPMNNCVAIDAKVLQNVNRPNPINLPTNIPNVVIAGAHDNSATALLLIGDTLKKTVYSVKRPNAFGIFNPVCGPPSGPGGTTCSNFPNAPQQVQAGDQVTYRIEKILPSSDAENLSIDDWLPVPTYTVSSINFANSACGVPGPANACLGPSDTLHSLPVSPNVTSNSTTNSINFNYGTFNNVANQPLKIDLLFTYAVTNLPFADGLFLTNEVQECETDTFGQPFCQVSIAQVNLREPRLVIRKAAVATDNPNGVFTPAPPPPGIFNLGGFLSGPINSANVGLINSNLTNVDANDLVTFAITIENLGGAPAYHVKVEDVIPNVLGTATCFTIVPNSFQVKRGTGAIVNPLLYTLVFPTSNGGFTITSNPLPIPINAHHPTNGTNIVVITFQAKLLGNVMPGCYDNTAEIKHYSSQLNGPDFVSNNLTPPFVDLAQVCVEPTLTKSVVATSEVHTAPQVSIVPQTPGNTPRLTIGEIARYRLVVQLPETGTLANVKITDALPGGMKFLRDNTARMAFVANGFGITHPSFGLPLGPPYNVVGNETTLPTLTLNAAQTIPNPFITVGTSCGDDPTFDLGNIKNNNLDTDLEFIVIEFNAQVCNSAGNVQGTMLPNTFSLVFNNATIATSPPINVRVFEPNLSIAKAASATTVAQGGTVAYTVTITNTGPLQAFDVQFTDTMAAGLTFVPNSTTVTGGCVLAGINSTSPAVTCSSVATGGVVTIKYNAIANPTSCPATLTNQAAVTWTSLPGPKGTAINPTLSNPTVVLGASGANGATDGERDGVTPSLAINNYAAAASRSVTVNCPPCVQPPHLMSAWWPFDEANGATVVNDFAGVNNQGMPKPGSPVGAPNSPSSVAGRVSGALKFDSAGSSTGPNIEVPNHPEINFGSSDFSIDAWVLVPQPPAVYIHPIVDKLQVNSAGTAGTGYALNLVSSFTNGARLEFLMGTGGSLAGYGPNAPWVPFNTWTHVTVTVNRGSGVVTFYINGTPLSAGGPPIPAGSLDNTLPLLIGESRLVGLGQQSITIDELELFKRVLPQPEIQGLVTAGGGGKCKCLNTSNETITCGANGTFNYTFTITNLSSSTMTAVNFGAGGGLTITPSSMTIPPLAPGASTNVTVVIGGPAAIAGANVCFSVGLVGGPPPSQGCRVQHCITLPACSTTGSLTVTKTISTPQPPPVLTPPSTAVFPVTVACQPSGYNQALSLTPSLLTQTFSNIPIGDTCTVTEGPLPAPFGNPVCAALGWAPPVYSPAQTVTISAASQTVSISNRFSCSTCAPPPPGMVGWWPMNVQSNQVNDIAPAPGSLFNNVGTAPAYQPVNGYVGGLGFGALYFNTLPASIVSVPSHPELNFVNGDFSIDAWVSVISGSGAIHPIVDKFNSPGGPGFAFYVRSGRLELNINGTTFVSTGPLMTPAANPQGNSGPWYHIAVSVQRNPAQVTFYLNGGQVGTYSPTNIGPVVNNLPLWIGGTRIAGNKLELSIDELELFNRVLNQTEIQQIFSAGAAGKCRQGIP
jgi:uncharacterized repeat protein (TIGR01451 family)